MKNSLNNAKNTVAANGKVIENYFFMTVLQILNSLFGILIYPYLIRVLGSESYGLYVFGVSLTGYFVSFTSFGFTFPALKSLIENKDNKITQNKIVSEIISAKLYLSIISTVVFLILLFTVPFLKNHYLIFIICYVQILSEIFFPVWYFQALQKMKIVTYIQLAFKIISLPFIFLLVKSPADNITYAIIISTTIAGGAFISLLYLYVKDKIIFRIASFKSIKNWYSKALPFFWSISTGTLKQESVTMIIGAFFGMRDVALYDLANKIIVLPRMLTTSINSALFPKVMEKVQVNLIKKIIKFEYLIGIAIILFIATAGYWLVLLLGGYSMLPAYPLAIILSITVLVWLVVGSYINFIFVPQEKNYFVTKNQLVAFGSFILFCGVGLLLSVNIFVVVIALTLSGLAEIIYCRYVIYKNKLL